MTETPSPLATLRVAEVMHRGLVTCRPETSLRAVAGILAAHHVHAVVVADDRGRDATHVHGVVSDLDLLATAVERGVDGVNAAAAARTAAAVVRAGESLETAARAMVHGRVTHLLVLDDETGRPVGVLSALDVADALA